MPRDPRSLPGQWLWDRGVLSPAIVVCLVFALPAVTPAADVTLQLPTSPAAPTPEQDDASLYDLCWVGAQRAWAVGSRGVVWSTDDGGESWRFHALPKEFSTWTWHSVCFLTDRVGWIAGGTVLPAGGVQQGTVLATLDGGQSWSPTGTESLPLIRRVQFFDLEQGVALGERSTRFPTGAMRTEDGGRTWQPFASPRSQSWSTGDFLSPEEGILAGTQGRQSLVARTSILSGSPGLSGLRNLHDVVLSPGGTSWMAGDGGLLLYSENRGSSWSAPPTRLPASLSDNTDFHCLACREDQVWAGGCPGSVIWHSPDGGRTWNPQQTGDPVPLRAISFFDSQIGLAVGDLGRICRTTDGGQTWHGVHGANRSLACLLIPTDARKTDLAFLTRWAREDGYRCGVLVATRGDQGADSHAALELDVRLDHAVQAAGGNQSSIDWRLPLALPSLERSRDKLLEEWQQLSDRRLEEVLLAGLVSQIRTWRPSVVLIEEPPGDDAAVELVQQAVQAALEQSGDPTKFSDQLTLCGLAPWTVRKLVQQRVPGGQGTIRQDPFEVLPHLAVTLDQATADATARLAAETITRDDALSEGRTYRVIRTFGNPPASDRTLLVDLGLAPGSPSRRELATIRNLDYDRLLTEARHRQQVSAISRRLASDPARGAQLLGQLKEIVQPLSPEAAARQLADMGALFRARQEWSSAEAVYSELVTRYPTEPAAVDAMLWLTPFWTSAEMNWQRLKGVNGARSRLEVNPAIIQANFEKALQVRDEGITNTGIELAVQTQAAPLELQQTEIDPSLQAGAGQMSQRHHLSALWQSLATTTIAYLKQQHPQLYDRPDVQFMVASLARRSGQPRQADEIYGRFMKAVSDDPWTTAARGEAHLLTSGAVSPKPIGLCRRTPEAPLLDGVLSDLCWTVATEIRLGGESDTESYIGTSTTERSRTLATPQPIVLFCHDDKYLYIAASIPVHGDLPAAPPQLPGRTHDADLGEYDRICLQFDVDRDYATCYRFEIDQRGWTREACWEDWSFNPQWYCSVERPGNVWRMECAIPLADLVPGGQVSGATWAVGITRVLPGIGAQGWTNSGANSPLPPLFGLLRFE